MGAPGGLYVFLLWGNIRSGIELQGISEQTYGDYQGERKVQHAAMEKG